MPVRVHPHVDDVFRCKGICRSHGDILASGRTGYTALREHREAGRSVRTGVAVKLRLFVTTDGRCLGQGRRRSRKGLKAIGYTDLIGQADDLPDPDLGTDVARLSRFG